MHGNCPKCGKAYSVRDSGVGRQARCSGCSHVFTVPPPAPAPDNTGATDTTYPDEVIAAVPVPVEPVIMAPRATTEERAAELAKSVAVLANPKILWAAGSAAAVLLFVGGLALGLNIHPPDQHELEKGYEAGYAVAEVAGQLQADTDYIRGVAEGKRQAGVVTQQQTAEAMKEVVKLKTATDSLVSRYNASETQVRHLNAELPKKIKIAEAASYSKGRERAEKKYDKQVAELISSHLVALSRTKRLAYKAGTESAGYKKWRDEGYDDGYKRGLADGKFQESNSRAALATDTMKATKELAHRRGYAAGERAGLKTGKEIGFDNGYARGHKEGHLQGYTQGYSDCRGSTRGSP